jgi:hypothetical protein
MLTPLQIEALDTEYLLERVVPRLAGIIDSDVVSTMCLVHIDITLGRESEARSCYLDA